MPWPFEPATLLFVALAVYILWRMPLLWPEEFQPQQPQVRSPMRRALSVGLSVATFVAAFLAALAVITYFQNPG